MHVEESCTSSSRLGLGLLSTRFIAYTLRVELDYNSGVAPKWPPCWTALECFQYPAGRFILPPFLSLIPSILVPPLSLSRRSTIASSFQSSFMPPGGEDLITRGEWRSLFFHPSPLQSTLLSIARATVLSFYPFPLPFSKVAVSRKPARSVFGPVFSYPFVQASRSRTNQVSRSRWRENQHFKFDFRNIITLSRISNSLFSMELFS